MRKLLALVVIAGCMGSDATVACDPSWNSPEPHTCDLACETRPVLDGMTCVASHPSTTAKHECLGTFVYDDRRGCCGGLPGDPDLVAFYTCD